MKLLLASNGTFLLNDGYKALGIPASELRIGYVTTASKVLENTDFVKRHEAAMQAAGYNFEEIDIEGKSEQELLDFFANKNIVHVEGGNTFYLLQAIRECAFSTVLRQLLEKGLVYVGSSAGAYIMCPTIEVSKWGRNASNAYGLTDLTALNYVPFCLKVHYTDDMETDVKKILKVIQHPLRILKDGQGILVEDGIYTFLGEGEEVTPEALV